MVALQVHRQYVGKWLELSGVWFAVSLRGGVVPEEECQTGEHLQPQWGKDEAPSGARDLHHVRPAILTSTILT